MVEYNSTLDKKLLHIPFFFTFYGSLNSYYVIILSTVYTLLRICNWVEYLFRDGGYPILPYFFSVTKGGGTLEYS